MRKGLLVIFVLVFAVSFAFADDNSSAVTQSGDNHTADVSQDGSGNVSEVSQTKTDYTYYSSGIDADIIQIGTDNESYVTQSMGAYGGGNRSSADVTQDGQENLLNLNQSGVGHQTATVNQQGQKNETDIQQSANHSISYVEQVGDVDGENYAHQRFAASQVEGRIIQSGDYNEAYQSMPYTPPVKNSYMESAQTGNNNYSEQMIVGDEWGFADGNNAATITQTGDGNWSVQSIVGRGNSESQVIEGNGNTVLQSQNGDNNSSTINIGPEDSYVGDDNHVEITQNVSGSKANVTLHGSDNVTEITQNAGSGDWHVVKAMKGDGNEVSITADNGGGNRGYWLLKWGSDNNMLTVDQSGSGNVAGGKIQSSSDNDISIIQHGDDNLVGSDPNNWNVNDGVVIMNGSLNTVDIQQMSDGNQTTVDISGSGNTATVTQN